MNQKVQNRICFGLVAVPRMWRFCVALLLILSLGACATSRQEDAGIPEEVLRSLSAREGLPGPTASSPALLRPGLVLNITVLAGGRKEIEELGRRIGEDGTITLPMLGVVRIHDETIGNLAARLTRLYHAYFVNPLVQVDFVRDDSPSGVSPWGHVTVLGRVARPGRVSMPPTRDLTVSMAIQLAGNLSPGARESAVRVFRREEDGEQITPFHVNLQAVGRRGRLENDIVLLPGDVVYVPQRVF
jgi:protein involved in polysaccharide export with SLBB domain